MCKVETWRAPIRDFVQPGTLLHQPGSTLRQPGDEFCQPGRPLCQPGKYPRQEKKC